MPNESNAYDTVIADLKRQRDEIEETITRLEALRVGQPAPSGEGRRNHAAMSAGTGVSQPENPADTLDNPYLGMSITDAVKHVLTANRKMMRAPDIVDRLEAGGLMLSGSNKPNTVGSVLNRRQRQVGDIVSPKRGFWGLKEWYPGRTFGKRADAMAAEKEKPEDPNETNEPVRPAEPPRIVPLHSSE